MKGEEENRHYLLNKDKIIQNRIRSTVSKIKNERGVSHVNLSNGEAYYIPITINGNVYSYDIGNFLKKGDSLIKSPNSAYLTVKKRNNKTEEWESFRFKIGHRIKKGQRLR